MAVNFSNPPVINNPTSHYNFFNSTGRRSSPLSSEPATPANLSPASPRSSFSPQNNLSQPYKSRQLRAPKAPMYIPAVLRPTECPAKFAKLHPNKISASAPITPPSSTGSSYDSKHSLDEALLHRRLINDAAPNGITRIVTDEWNEDKLEDVTGEPTRDHWKPDPSSLTCDYPTCDVAFTFLNRRHHCRRCGLIFCQTHSLHKVPLDQIARFHPGGFWSRACTNCHADFKAWRNVRKLRANGSQDSGSTTPVPIKHSAAGDDNVATGPASKRKESLAESYGPESNWSTF